MIWIKTLELGTHFLGKQRNVEENRARPKCLA
jgi:hypothetical protein